MNILYIGPYRSLSIDGYLSLNLLLNLKDLKQYTVTARPIFISNRVNNLASKLNDTILSMENHQSKSFDLLIQNTEINTISYNSKIPYHIFFPNYKDIIPDDSISQKYVFLSNRGLLLYSNNIHKKLLEYLNIDNGLFLNNNINNKLLSPTNNIFNLGIYNRYKKYYTIIQSNIDYDTKKIIVDFIKLNQENNCLVLFIQDIDQEMLNRCNEYIKSVYKKFEINNTISKVIIVPTLLNETSIRSIHNTGDVYIHKDNELHLMLAKEYGKHIVLNTSNVTIQWDQNDLHKYGKLKNTQDSDLLSEKKYPSLKNNLSEIIDAYVK